MAMLRRVGKVFKGRVPGYQRAYASETGKPEWLKDHLANPQGAPVHGLGAMSELSSRQKRALYRSKQRGWLEMDVILGRWTSLHMQRLLESQKPGAPPSVLGDEQGMAQLERILDAETPDIFKWVTGQQEPPADVGGSTVFQSIQEFAFGAGNISTRKE
ncbi:Succinate dehydrogenase assembly factor 2, mitochondrial [Porphyridium purpureum]|uniref:Succinate dehydrogenase assembly factor 2, mitochondrial n=1 Tax=Porphyridium purpureum TaxID=35688 RepID=A0A5J4YQH3_PORPP|nr:Succinate dehydrogenase assembly factor 2, mitochondrial [Porphyridium purpureum]|eukprot:POR5483..scf222_8